MALSPTIYLNGVFSLLIVTVYLIVGISILAKFKKRQNKFYILTGIAWIGISEPWWPSSISFIVALFNETGLNVQTYLIINNNFLPIFLLLWILVVTNLVNIKHKNLIIILYSVSAVFLEFLVIFYLITDIALVGILLSPVDLDFGIITTIYLMYILLLFIITGLIFALKTMKIGDKISKLRGNFLLIAILLYLVGAILEIIITFPVNRILILLSAVAFYIGFIMPDSIKNKFIKS